MRKILRRNLPCGYCGNATENDHVIARQFFPPQQAYRGQLPQVPACRTCNGDKQKVEDGPGVVFQFGHSSNASRQLLFDRVPRTLQKNKRLHGSLQRGLQNVLVRQSSGLLVPSLVLKLSPKDLSDIWCWFRYVARGLYCFEFQNPLPTDHTIHLISPSTFEHFTILRDLIAADAKRQEKSYASDELRYLYTHNSVEQLTMWLLAFKSIEMFWITVGPLSAPVVSKLLAQIEWNAIPTSA